MSSSVYVTGKGDDFHTRPDCPAILRGQNTAHTMGWTVHQPEEVTRAEAEQRGQGKPCPQCQVAPQ
ncbi:hypothetical protein RM572_00600 [Streptomyces sp. DSM 42041]|uniref:Uncharacterized protein n=1 Tax=Streptomyces hazeniae TaxID=3075538 RepID=A0ABU2NKI1_9ACTN|nr:hypothetical protein [Streptomyces sp. DSM 42041]MDT0377275.1 hypothetical protein [Streptomyces sp. DSM 42041]